MAKGLLAGRSATGSFVVRAVRRGLLSGAVVLGLLTTASGTGGAATGSTTPFVLAGTVQDNAAPIDPTNVPGSNAAFILHTFTEVSSSAQPFVSNGQATVYATPETKFFLLNASTQTYRPSDYAHTVVVGQQVRTYGRYTQLPDGSVRFVAFYVWNPPTTPAGSAGAVPKCGDPAQLTQQQYKAFLVQAYVADDITND